MRLTVAQTLIRFLSKQHTERDGVTQPLFAGVMGIFGHGNLAGIGEAMHAESRRHEGLRYVPVRNEQAMVHAAAAYAKTAERLTTWACTTSIGPGATNLVTGAATATINRLPVLLLPGDVFATHRSGAVLQELEHPSYGDWSVNDCLRPVSRYFHRITRAEQLPDALLQAMRILTDPAETGAVTLALPQDVQAESWEVPPGLLRERIWHVARAVPEPAALTRAAELLAGAQAPLIVAGGGVKFSGASAELERIADEFEIPVCETQAGKGSLPFDHPQNVGPLGATGSAQANALAARADVVVGVGTRWSDFTTASRTVFANPDVKFINLNVCGFDAIKHSGEMLIADARAGLVSLGGELRARAGRVSGQYSEQVAAFATQWQEQVVSFTAPRQARSDGRLAQAEVIGAVQAGAGESGIVVCAAGSLPGDLHRLWRATDPESYHMEYGYSCMGYEVAGALGVKLAEPNRNVVAMVGDGSWLMLSSEVVTAVQEQIPLVVVLVDNHGYGSIGALSASVGSEGFGTRHRHRDGGDLTGEPLPVDYEASARAYGAHAVTATTYEQLAHEVRSASGRSGPTVVVVRTHTDGPDTPGGAWWDVPVAETTDHEPVRVARELHEQGLARQRTYL